jgi:hypothetical protein
MTLLGRHMLSVLLKRNRRLQSPVKFEVTHMKFALSTGVLILFLGTASSAYARQEKGQEDHSQEAKPEAQQGQPTPKQQPQAKPSDRQKTPATKPEEQPTTRNEEHPGTSQHA